MRHKWVSHSSLKRRNKKRKEKTRSMEQVSFPTQRVKLSGSPCSISNTHAEQCLPLPYRPIFPPLRGIRNRNKTGWKRSLTIVRTETALSNAGQHPVDDRISCH